MSIDTPQSGDTLIDSDERNATQIRQVVVSYPDDLVILLTGMISAIMNDIMEGALGKVCLWTTRCAFGTNLTKRELKLFTTKARYPNSAS